MEILRRSVLTRCLERLHYAPKPRKLHHVVADVSVFLTASSVGPCASAVASVFPLTVRIGVYSWCEVVNLRPKSEYRLCGVTV